MYSGTQSTTKIVGQILRGPNHAPLGSIRDAATAAGSASASGAESLSVVNLSHFDLINGGFINLQGGIGTLSLRSVGQNTQIHAAILPTSTSSTSSTSGSTNTLNNGTLTGATGNNQPNTVVTSPNGQGTAVNSGSGQPVAGSVTTSTGTSILNTGSSSSSSSTAATPTGPEITIQHVDGAARATAIGNAQIFGYDPVAGAVIRFDSSTGAALQSIPVPATGTPIAGTGLGRNNGHQVVLVGVGSTVFAYDVVTGAAVGSFSTTSLSAEGLTHVDGIGSSDVQTFVSDSAAGTTGLIQGIDVTASLARGQAVPIGSPFTPSRGFVLSGGLTGLAGTNLLYATGAAHFDTFTPDQLQEGILTFSPASLTSAISTTLETSRNAIPNPLTGGFINVGSSPAAVQANATMALGSIGGSLALDTGVVNGRNLVELLAPSNNAISGAVSLGDNNLLAGLSESFHPELANAALVDISGNLRHFYSKDVTGLVLNASGAINLIGIDRATDSAIVGRPLNHVAIGRRTNVTLLSTARGSSGNAQRHGVTVLSALKPYSTFTLP